MTLRVATYNIRHGRGLDDVVDLERTAAVIRAMGAGLVALQEVDRARERSRLVDQPARLAELTGLHVRFHPTLADGGEYGLALLADEPLETSYEALPRLGEEEPRGAVVTRWRDIGVIATHLSAHRDVRSAQLERLAAIAIDLGPPAILLGDLNETRRGLDPLQAAGFHVPRARRVTVAGRFVGRQIDHVLTSPGLRQLGSWTLGRGASDHLALVAEVRHLRPAPE